MKYRMLFLKFPLTPLPVVKIMLVKKCFVIDLWQVISSREWQ